MSWAKEILEAIEHQKNGRSDEAKNILENLIHSDDENCARASKIALANLLTSTEPEEAYRQLKDVFQLGKDYQVAVQLLKLSAAMNHVDGIYVYYEEAQSLIKDNSLSKTMALDFLVLRELIKLNQNEGLRNDLMGKMIAGYKSQETLDYHFLTARNIPAFDYFLIVVCEHFKTTGKTGFRVFLEELQSWVDESGRVIISEFNGI